MNEYFRKFKKEVFKKKCLPNDLMIYDLVI